MQQSCHHVCIETLCKGQAVAEILDRPDGRKYPFVAYIGDGSNDYCGCARLARTDLVFARRGFPLHKMIFNFSIDSFRVLPCPLSKASQVQARSYGWQNGKEILDLIQVKKRAHDKIRKDFS